MIRKKENPDKELLLRVKTIMTLRLVFLTGFVGTLLVFQQRFGFSAPMVPISIVMGTAYFLSLVYALLFNVLDLPKIAVLQVTGDLLVVGGIIFTTGGIHSPLSFLYLFVIIATSVMLRRAACYLVASGASIIYGLLVDLEYFSMISPVHLFTETNISFESGYGFYIIALNISSYFSVAYLSSILSDRLCIIKEELSLTSTDLRELREFNKNVVQNMGNGLITTNLSGQITSINLAAEVITGHSLQECLGSPAETLLPFHELKELLSRPEAFSLPRQIDGKCCRKNGDLIFIRMKVSRLSGNEASGRGYICVFEDLTGLKEMEEKIFQAEQLAAVGRFSAGLAHEIRNPLASLSGSIQVLSKKMKLDGACQKLMHIVTKETDRLNIILTDFLNYAQPRKNNETLVDLTQTVQDVVSLLKNSSEIKPSVKIHLKNDKGHCIISTDEKQIKQMIWNLCINGLQSMPVKGTLEIGLKLVPSFRCVNFSSERKGVLLIIRDQGCGIPEDQMKRIFDPFFTTKHGGVGLGLATVYQIVQRNGGNIQAESEIENGTCFTVYLPDQGRDENKTPVPADKNYGVPF